ncbi:MAG: hypothetical protein KDB27_24875 [Planctomycetales bacterium]|nr:hypothetical protein [Planctomycetales bacterium]
MSSDALRERGRNLEEAFFAQKNKELLHAFHEKLEADEKRAAITAATGICDEKTLDELLAIGVDAQSLAAVTIIPLIRVAWADRNIGPKERDAIMAAAKDACISEGDAAYDLLKNWLDDRPHDNLFNAWVDYVSVLKETVDASIFSALASQVTKNSTAVAKAAGGLLGIGAISAVEQKVLDEIAQALS